MLVPDRTWPPDYRLLVERRVEIIHDARKSVPKMRGLWKFYREHPVEFICDWVNTVDPRNAGKPGMMVTMPFHMFERQRDMILFLMACLNGEANGMIEKARDIGATWGCCAFSVWMWIFWSGSSIGWGSRKQDLVDRIGDMDSIFEKMRAIIRSLPPMFKPPGLKYRDHMHFMRLINPSNESTITGESGDDIGRGGRKRIYFKDESAHYEHPEMIEASLLENTRVQIDISSVNGVGNVFHRKRQTGVVWEPGDPVRKDVTNVFIFDWRDHPAKTAEWYKTARQKNINEGLLHKFKQEVDRDYAASQEGILIEPEWIKAAIDAHIKLNPQNPEVWEQGEWMAGLDIYDEGMDANGIVVRKGRVIKFAREWGERDTGTTTRNTIASTEGRRPIKVMFDIIGVGAGVRSEVNRLIDEKLMPKDVQFVAWSASAEPLDADKRIIPDDRTSPINKDFFENLKAQAGFKLRLAFEKTYRAVTEGLRFPISDLIAIDSKSIPIGTLRLLEAQLAQPQMTRSARLKFMIDKTPEGTRSPNLYDGTAMCFWPVKLPYDIGAWKID